MTAPEHLTISGPEDILGYIPHSLGYWPSQSLVAMTMQGKRLGATLRVDLPEGGGRRGREAFARTVADYLLADKEADGTLLAFFAAHGFDEPGREGAPPAFRLLLADLECALGLAGMPVRDAWLVGEEYWRNVYCTDSCCPLPGRPVAEIRDSRLNAEMVYLGSSVGAPPGATPPEGAGAPAADDPAVMAAERDWHQALRGKGTLRAQFEAVLDAWSAALQAVASAPAPTAGVPPAAGSRGAGSRGAGSCEGGPPLDGPLDAGPPVVGQLDAGPPVAGPLGAGSPGAGPLDEGIPAAEPLTGPVAEHPLAAGRHGALEPEFAGFLRASLRVPAWRDAVLVMAAAGRAAAAAGAEAFGIFSAGTGAPVSSPPLPAPQLSSGSPGRTNCGPEGIPEAEAAAPETEALEAVTLGTEALPGYGEVLLGLSPAVPDWDALKRLENLMQQLSSCGGGEAQAAALTATGWIEWCRGRGSFAHASLTRALEARPGYRLAELLSEVVRRGTICGWAGRREAAWQRFGSDAA
ncbi:DUF4192 family protein [Arthrobacter sp. NPDC057388]|uniref:DUF4192 family protein n=1 Tax=Arthrobacter sp. NPDC057388 TaxID=3346116 RepID=UPI003638D422